MDSPTRRPDDRRQKSHRLPLPPITTTRTCPVSPIYSPAKTPRDPRSPGRAENPRSPGSRWKKGRLLGRGTFGHVYLGFNSESGEMCAMKEVTLFADDAKSKECAQQLGQEIALLSRLRHQNIVQYYGSEMVDDKLYIYLYVSGGSIYKLLQVYGQFGEIVIRSYTQQILSGLSYLHTKEHSTQGYQKSKYISRSEWSGEVGRFWDGRACMFISSSENGEQLRIL